ncbi:MAG: S46 family peptidase [Marinifilaceae bacterium]|jgi:undecaprenyl pyrophosphate synthase|nr:S46 family peptidase [Marinifilaceae bacterium]
MRKLLLAVVTISFMFSFNSAKADEGMWLLSLLKKNAAEMKKMGLEITADDIYNVNNASLKDAIVGLGRAGRPFSHFCSGEIISDQGLFLTNHHCGFGSIQSHSTPEHDYLFDGFWAYNKKEELTNEGLTASILVRMEDVSKQVNAKLNDDMSEMDRYKAIREVARQIEKKAEEGTHYKANVKSMFNGNQFFLFVYVIYKDVRLVGAPPSSMGKFGGDTDNWMWPRHTADFSMFRIYTGPDGKPAEYSEKNIPLKPKHHLPISIKGVEEGDFAMVMGFPGTTDRYLTSYGLDETMKIRNHNVHKIRTVKLNILHEDMAKDAAIRIKYASKYASSANYWKYSNEQNKALTKLNTKKFKQEIEEDYNKWANKKAKRKAKYGEALNMIEKSYKTRKDAMYSVIFLGEALNRGAEAPGFAANGDALLKVLKAEKSNKDVINKTVEKIKAKAEPFYKDYNEATDIKLMAGLFKLYSENTNKEEQPSIFAIIANDYNNDFKKFAEETYAKSVFSNKEKLFKFLANPNAEVLANDPLLNVSNSITDAAQKIYVQLGASRTEMNKGKRLFVDGLLQINKKKNLAPDANSTIRLTYGKVGGYVPRDGAYYNHYTTLKGVMEKEDANNPEFIVPAKLKDLYGSKDYGQYTDKDGKIRTCFLTNNDITGGNSGSPVINSRGELIGTAFDGNSEAMSGDIDFEENLQRCINVDARYVLFIIEKYAGATNLIKEMTIVK